MLGLDVFRRKPHQFEYKPLHYDPLKEARDKRRKELLGVDEEDFAANSADGEYKPGTYIRAHGLGRKSTVMTPRIGREQRTRSIRRAIIVLIMLFAILIYMLLT